LWTGQPEPLPVVFVETTIPSATPQQLAGYDIEPINPAQLPGAPEFRFGTPYPTLLSYPIPTPNVIPTSIGTQAPDISPVVRIVVPALSLDTEVKYVPFDGLTWLISGLRQEIAWLGNTSWPGLGGNTVLAGHVTVRGMGDGPFRYLDQMQVNDEITIYTENNIYLYRVREQTVVEEGDLWVTDPTENAQLTLITCTDWNQDLSQYIRRLIVFADLVRVEPLHTAGSN
jgi:sortase A